MKTTASFRLPVSLGVALAVCATVSAQQPPADTSVNLAIMAKVAAPGGFGGGNNNFTSPVNNGIDPQNSSDRDHGAYSVPRRGGRGNFGAPQPTGTMTNSVQYIWSQPVSTKSVAIYWQVGGGRGGRGGSVLPKEYRLKYWDGEKYVPVANASGLGLEQDKYNVTTFDEVKTERLRLEYDADAAGGSPAILQWKVFDSGATPNFAPVVTAGIDRDVVLGGKTYLLGAAKDEGKPKPLTVTWTKDSGPGEVQFADAKSPATTAAFSKVGDYVLKLTAFDGEITTAGTLTVKVNTPPPADRLDVVYTKNYRIDNPLWNARAKALIVGWIPHCIDEINDPNLPQGGINNFIEAGKKLKGEPAKPHVGYPFANAWVHQTVEAMCIALMIDPQGDQDIIKAQDKMKATLEDWIPRILGAQEPDGYLQTRFTLGTANDRGRAVHHWDPATRGEHEGYVAGYFIESAINHYTMTNGKDKRLYDAAKKLADCWCANLGPGKKDWYDGHQEMEQALVRFGRFVNDMEGNGRGDNYIKLAKFLLDSRRGGSEYDQSHLPMVEQYEAVGHAVRAAYTYSGMADVAAETHDTDYQSAVMSLWDNIVNRKYYLTGGIGSGETSEGFGPDYSLQNNAYCESCSSCGLIFFQWKMNLAYHDAKFADLYEETIYNALLGATDLEGKNFYYTNPLLGGTRTAWHTCPCCVGNIPRTLLMIPTWTYVKDKDGIYVNLFIGSTINVEKVAGTDVQMVQKTDYPWSGKVAITVNPKVSKEFSVHVRVPNRTTSELYTETPAVSGLTSIALNGKAFTPQIENGYVTIHRNWNPGDKIELELPMKPQLVKASDKIAADRGLVALRYGPLIYNVERADKQDINQPIDLKAPLTTEWRSDLLGGVMVIKGRFADGSPLTAIPNYARNNRLGETASVARNGAVGGDASVDYSGNSGAATAGGTNTTTNATGGARRGGNRSGGSIVWLKAAAETTGTSSSTKGLPQ